LRVRAVRVGNATTTARIAAFIKSALDRKPAIQSKAERLAEHRVLLTLGLGVISVTNGTLVRALVAPQRGPIARLLKP
jgi:cation transport ATPase